MGCFVKICGLCNDRDVKSVAELSPDAMGFIFWENSKRFVAPEQVGDWASLIPEGITKVGVFVDAPSDRIDYVMKKADLDVVQLHGEESPLFVEQIRYPVWKAIHLERVREEELFSYRVDAFLLDSYSEGLPGGTGRVHDWQKAKEFVGSRNWKSVLAGGLTPENVSVAIQTVQPWGVDVSSGVESKNGTKDIERVRSFIEQCRES